MNNKQKTVIRHGVFETNSSSTHSVSWGNYTNKKPAVYFNDRTGKIPVSCGEFGWEIESYNDFTTKLSYLITWLVNTGNFEEDCDEYNNLEYVIISIYPTFSGFELGDDLSDDDLGYIDHQSMNVARDVLQSRELIKDFLFNTQTYLILDNDNH